MSRLLKVTDIKVDFPIGKAGLFGRQTTYVRAVDGVSFEIQRGETLGLVGESGSGKTTLGRAVLRALEPTSGQIVYEHNDTSVDIMGLDRNGLRAMWRHMQMIFQDPYSSLNPRMTVRDVIGEPLIANKMAKGSALNDRVVDMAQRCGLNVTISAASPMRSAVARGSGSPSPGL